MADDIDNRTELEKKLDAHLSGLSAQAQYHMLAAGAATKLKGMMDDLDRIKPMLDEFVKEKDKLGEFDANAGAIIQISHLTQRLHEVIREHLHATLQLFLKP